MVDEVLRHTIRNKLTATDMISYHANHSSILSIERSRMSSEKRNEISHDLPATFLFVKCKLRGILTIE